MPSSIETSDTEEINVFKKDAPRTIAVALPDWSYRTKRSSVGAQPKNRIRDGDAQDDELCPFKFLSLLRPLKSKPEMKSARAG